MTGTITISIELELAWGQHDEGGSDIQSADRSAEEDYFDRLLNLCDRYQIPITFDVVGHLLLEQCSGHHEGPHENGWFAADPGTDAESNPLYYWPELPEIIQKRNIDHEVATHTFSHTLGDKIDNQTLQWELEKCAQLHEQTGLGRPKTMVPPRHKKHSSFYRAMADTDIEGIRTLKTFPRESTTGRYKQRAKFWLLDRGHPAYAPQRTDGIVEMYTTPYPSLTTVLLPNGQRRTLSIFEQVPVALRKRIHRSYLSGAIETATYENSNVHLWTHLYNMSNESQWDCIAEFLERLAGSRDRGDVEVVTMAELTNRCN